MALAAGEALAVAGAIADAIGATESVGAGRALGSEVIAFGVAATCDAAADDPVCKIIARRSARLYANAPPPKSKPRMSTPPMSAGALLFFGDGGGREFCGYATAAAPSVALLTCEIGSDDACGASIPCRGAIG
jgi:hypothetical protein